MYLLKHKKHRGATVVEFAVVAIPMFLFVFFSIEIGRAMLASQSMEEAARIGCRIGIVKDATPEMVTAEVDKTMRTAGIKNYSIDINPNVISTLEQWEPVTVTITAPYSEISWLPAPIYLKDTEFTASCSLPKECEADN